MARRKNPFEAARIEFERVWGGSNRTPELDRRTSDLAFQVAALALEREYGGDARRARIMNRWKARKQARANLDKQKLMGFEGGASLDTRLPSERANGMAWARWRDDCAD